MVYEIQDTKRAAFLFAGWQETLIWSCLQKVMGHIYANDPDMPSAAMAKIADFCFFAGKADKELVMYKPENCTKDFMILVPQNQEWAELIVNCYGEKAKKTMRYAIKKEPDVFDIRKLQKAVETLPVEYTLKMIDRDLFYWCREKDWCNDWVAQYRDYEMYEKYGMGAVILKGNQPVSGASSYSGYQGGIEIQIDTKPEYRRQGLAFICGAKLILECLKRGWYPSWDAQNPWSAELAKKLGYHLDREYLAYEIQDY